jgi:Protein of unknown function (DUF3168)
VAGSRVRDCVNAAVDALKVDIGLLALVGTDKVHTHLKQGTDPPYVLLMGGDELPWAVTFAMDDSGDNGARQVDVVVQCASTYRGSMQVDSIASRVMEVLTDDAIWSGVTGFQVCEFVRNAFQPPVDLNSDGVLWFQRFVTVRVSLV